MTDSPVYVKAPGERKYLAIDWSDFLGDDQIASSVWSVSGPDSPAGLEPEDEAGDMTSSPPTGTAVWLPAGAGGGIAGENYSIANTITTAGGQVETRTLRLYCRSNP